MKERPSKDRPPQILSGWKEIAKYLGKGVRTVQRYERELGLPVRRPTGKPCGSVIATAAELDAWVGASPIREVFRLAGQGVESECAVMADRIKRGLAEMTRLRRQMFALRRDVRASVNALTNSLYDLQGALNQNWWAGPGELPGGLANTDSEQARHHLYLLTASAKRPKNQLA